MTHQDEVRRPKRRTSMNNYEVVDLFEVGSAGATIMDKGETNLDEWVEPSGRPVDALDE